MLQNDVEQHTDTMLLQCRYNAAIWVIINSHLTVSGIWNHRVKSARNYTSSIDIYVYIYRYCLPEPPCGYMEVRASRRGLTTLPLGTFD